MDVAERCLWLSAPLLFLTEVRHRTRKAKSRKRGLIISLREYNWNTRRGRVGRVETLDSSAKLYNLHQRPTNTTQAQPQNPKPTEKRNAKKIVKESKWSRPWTSYFSQINALISSHANPSRRMAPNTQADSSPYLLISSEEAIISKAFPIIRMASTCVAAIAKQQRIAENENN
ncbi:hypothetical protein DdX_15636 [Ditylenchus destructor]|uniref:Uncharacterized protein n=1 Tax=Ditylenchus destructor TaxID=166010 RepID=A0AAD4MQJ6_9BILA|nr:hypothetical protein DdX_15636 [Ditylenchus destructor]